MSRKLFGFLNESKNKQKTIKVVVDETVDGPFERRVSVSNSGRWKQKNKHRSVVTDDVFTAPKDHEAKQNETSNGSVNKEIRYTDSGNVDGQMATTEAMDDGKLETAL